MKTVKTEKVLCPDCRVNECSGNDSEYGVLKCEECLDKDGGISRPTKAFDFASPLTKLHRKEYAPEMFQPYVNGVLSKEFIEANGTSKLAGVGEKEIKKAKYVYSNMTRHHKMTQQKPGTKSDMSKKIMSKR